MSDFGSHRSALPAGYPLHWYSIERVLGRGGFGITYLASDNNLGQLAAIKEFLPTDLAYRTSDNSIQPLSEEHTGTYQWGLGRFLVEARTLARFRHPNIVLVHSVFEANNTAYIVMEYETGSNLEEAFAAGTIKTESQLTALLLSLMDGVECMHQEGFVHRDIKPSNIYLRDNNHPVLLDFGSARQALGMETRTLTTMVSPGYAPFEQYNANRENDGQGPWTDIYALASTIYRGIAGKDPSDALSQANERIKGVGEILDPATRIGHGRYSERFLYALDVAMRFNAYERPQSISQWRDLLVGNNPVSPDAVTVASYPADVVAGMTPPPQQISSNQPPLSGQYNTVAPNTYPSQTGGHNTSYYTNNGPVPTNHYNEDAFNSQGAGSHPNWQHAQPPRSQATETFANNPIPHSPDPASHAPQSISPELPAKKGLIVPALLGVIAVGIAGIFFVLLRDNNNGADVSSSAQLEPTSATTVKAETTTVPAAELIATYAEIEAIVDTDCASLVVSDAGLVTGYATDTAMATIRSSIANLSSAPSTDLSSTSVYPSVFCDTINTIGSHRSVNLNDLTIKTTIPESNLVEGDRLVLEMQSSAYSNNFFYVDYFSLDGGVAHLLDNASEQTNNGKKDEVLILGEPGGIERWDIAPPFGEEMISVVVSNKLLAITNVQEAESAADYLKKLSEAIDNNTANVTATLLKIQTRGAQ